MFSPSHFSLLFKTACYSGGGFLSGALFGVVIAGSIPRGPWATLVVVMAAAFGGAAGSMLGAKSPHELRPTVRSLETSRY